MIDECKVKNCGVAECSQVYAGELGSIEFGDVWPSGRSYALLYKV